MADRTEVIREGSYDSWQEAFATALDIMQERHLKDVHRVEIDSGEFMETLGGERTQIGKWSIKIEGFLGE